MGIEQFLWGSQLGFLDKAEEEQWPDLAESGEEFFADAVKLFVFRGLSVLVIQKIAWRHSSWPQEQEAEPEGSHKSGRYGQLTLELGKTLNLLHSCHVPWRR